MINNELKNCDRNVSLQSLSLRKTSEFASICLEWMESHLDIAGVDTLSKKVLNLLILKVFRYTTTTKFAEALSFLFELFSNGP